MPEKASPTRSLQSYFPHHLSLHPGNTVKSGQLLVKKGIAPIDHALYRSVFPDQGVNKKRSLIPHRLHQRFRTPRIINRIFPNTGSNIVRS